jgi:GNAT superfamily N-acetyltransferase
LILQILQHSGPRNELRTLFQLAEDSTTELNSYIDSGRVLVAVQGDQMLGHLQLIETSRPEVVELKSMAVIASHQGRGIGRALVLAALNLAREESHTTMVVSTAAASTGNLRFYQLMGFRLRAIERDAFTDANGYPPGLRLDGIELRDRVWLDRAV